MKNYLRLLQRASGTPHFIAEDKLTVITDNVLLPLAMGIAVNKNWEEPKEKLEIRSQNLKFFSGQVSQTTKTAPGVNDFAVITVFDTLTAKNDPWASGGTSYESIKKQIDTAVSDGYKNLMFYIDSPGGEAQGLFELTSYIRELSAKGIFTASFTDGHATSAAYAIPAATDVFYSTQSSIIGSIAAIMVHLDTSKADTAAGRTYTIIRSKPDKAIPDSKTPLSEAGMAKLTNLVDKFDTMFNNDIVASRASLTVQDLIAMRGADYLAEDASQLKLIDGIVKDINFAASSALAFKDKSWKPAAAQAKTKLQTKPSGVKMNEEELKLALEAEKSARLSAEAAGVKAVADERARCSAIVKAAGTLKLGADCVEKHIVKGYDAETSLDIMTEIAQHRGVSTAVDSASQQTTVDPDLDAKMQKDIPATSEDRMASLRAAAQVAGLQLYGAN